MQETFTQYIVHIRYRDSDDLGIETFDNIKKARAFANEEMLWEMTSGGTLYQNDEPLEEFEGSFNWVHGN